MLQKDYRASVQLEKTLVVNHKGLGPKMKWLAVNRQS
jgi:hypothetical protein